MKNEHFKEIIPTRKVDNDSGYMMAAGRRNQSKEKKLWQHSLFFNYLLSKLPPTTFYFSSHKPDSASL